MATVDKSCEDMGGGKRLHLPMRFIMAIMGSVGLAILYGFKVNASVAIVAMVNHTAVAVPPTLDNVPKADIICASDTQTNNTLQNGPFVWTEPVQGLILSSYFWGYIISLMPGGRMAELVSAKWVMMGSVVLNVVAALLTPELARIHHFLFISMRVLQGIGGGVSFPAMHVMVAKWAPPNERSFIASIVYAGTALGTVISTVMSGYIAATLSWEWIFYIEGLLCIFWCIAWGIMVADSPEEQKILITERERNYIMSSLGHTEVNRKIPPFPWAQVFKSPPFWAILVTHFCNNFGWYMLLIELPTFMNKILRYDMSENAFLSALPYLCMWLFTMGLSKVLTIMQDKTWISVTVSRKIGTLFASAVPMFCLLGASYVGCNRALAVVLMTIGIMCIGGMYCGFLANHIDLAPNFAGTLMAITNTVATIPGFVVPIFVGELTHQNQTIEAWRVIFFVTVGLYLIEMLIYTMFGTGEEQPWNKLKQKDEEVADPMVPLNKESSKH